MDSRLEGRTSEQASAPHEQDIDPVLLMHAYKSAGGLPALRSLLVVRHGRLVGERYFGGHDRDTVLNVKSVSKSILSALVGIALREGFLGGLEQPVSTWLPEYFGPEVDPRKREITLRHLLTMSAGLRWVENADYLRPLFESPDWLQATLELPLVDIPGRRFNYSTALAHLTSAILTRTSGMSTYTLADEYLFGLLGISIEPWTSDPQGYFVGGTDIRLSARDMARFGQLMLQRGHWNGTQVVPEAWVDESTRPQIALPKAGFWHPAYTAYGYYWWLRKMGTHEAAVASGYGGQLIYVIPTLDLVLVTTADASVPFSSVMQQSNAIEDFIEASVIPSVQV
jgi:CubicO group peptidase (beta-lactamase class C family)